MMMDQKFWAKVLLGDGCWEWIGHIHRSGYGRVMRWAISKDGTWAHRYSWMLANGPIPEGMLVLHKCDNRSCVRPSHLFLGSHADNMADASKKGRMRNAGKPCAKLKVQDVWAIRKLYLEGARQRDLAKQFGVAQSTVSEVVNNKYWSYV